MEYQQLRRTKRWEQMAELQTAVTESLGPTCQVQAGEIVDTLILKTTEGPMPQNQMWPKKCATPHGSASQSVPTGANPVGAPLG